MTMSASFSASALTVAPAAVNSESGRPDLMPAPGSTAMSTPSALNFFTVSGEAATRGSDGSIFLATAIFIRLIVLLRHKRRRFDCRVQQGQRERFRAMATISLRRIVAIEFGMGRSGRSGGASGSVTVGNRKFLERPGGTRSRGGNRLPLGDQESVGRDAQRSVVVEATPTSPFEMPEPDLLFEILIIALDAPSQLG